LNKKSLKVKVVELAQNELKQTKGGAAVAEKLKTVTQTGKSKHHKLHSKLSV
jgi:hypothetical protein